MNWKVKDHYYNQAKKDNYFARSIYKLQEIDSKYKVLKKGDYVVDLGYFPGSWIQYTASKVGEEGKVVGIDIQQVDGRLSYLKNVEVFHKDINEIQNLEEIGVTEPFNVVLSDMAPSTTGVKSVDQDRSLQLIEMIFYHLPKMLRVDGNLVFKIFDSHQAQMFIKTLRKHFAEVKNFKPKSTRSVSKEFFVICKGYKGTNEY